MLDLEERLDDAVGALEPSFTLDDIVRQGRRKRRVHQARLIATRSAVVVLVVAGIALVGNRLSPVESSNVATQPDEPTEYGGTQAAEHSGPPRFMKPGPDSDAWLHLPTFFDREPLTAAEQPETIRSIVAETAVVWDLEWPERDGSSFVSLDLERHTACVLRERVLRDGELGGTCMSLHDLATRSWALPQPRRQNFYETGDAVALAAFQHQGKPLTSALETFGGRGEDGIVLAAPGTPKQVVTEAMSALLAERSRSVRGAGSEVSVAIDGRRRSLSGTPVESCVVTDGAASVMLRLREGSLLITARTTDDGVVKLDRYSGVITTASMFAPIVSDFSTIIFMEPRATTAELAAMRDRLAVDPATSSYDFVDQTDAYAEFRVMFADDAHIRDSIDEADLPTSFRFAKSLGSEGEAFRELPGVFEVVERHPALELPSVDDGTATATLAFTERGPIVHGTYEHDGDVVDVTVACGRDYLDARTASWERPPPRVSSIEAMEDGDRVGALRIPAIGVDVPIARSVNSQVLQASVGSYRSTVLPGMAGNAAVAGHRTTYGAPFLRLDELEPGDIIIASTADGRFLYEVSTSMVVSPSEIQVLEDHGDSRLTLTTEHPAYGSEERLVITAELLNDAVAPHDLFSTAPSPPSLD